ncbi:MAG: orotidine-5'-phosphate decarboxylase [Bacteroidota bacterium]
MTRAELFEQILQKKSFLCVGLDPDLSRFPKHFEKKASSIIAFNKQIIEATQDLCVAYKPNLAFYEALGMEGWKAFEETLKLIPDEHFVIADAKRGDIGNTSKKYAQAFFETYNCDAITIAPYMGEDSVKPFLDFQQGKWTILLALTSNAGSKDYQLQQTENGYLFEQVLVTSKTWGNADQLMYVVGATKPEWFEKIRSIVPDHFLLVPGVGAQGGSLKEVCKHGMNEQVGLLVNSSRSIIYASEGEDFAEAARRAAMKLQQEMKEILSEA